jgi:prophage maintenance system killer protein
MGARPWSTLAAAETEWYPVLADILALHARMLRDLGENLAPLQTGGQERLAAAIARPAWARLHAGADLAEQAALLAIGIAQAQALVDNNQRLAYLAGVAFLRRNGHPLPAERSFAFGKHIEGALEQRRTVADVGAWLRGIL